MGTRGPLKEVDGGVQDPVLFWAWGGEYRISSGEQRKFTFKVADVLLAHGEVRWL